MLDFFIQRFRENIEGIIDEMLGAYAQRIPVYSKASPQLLDQVRQISKRSLESFLEYLQEGKNLEEFGAALRVMASEREMQGFALNEVLRAFWVGQWVAWHKVEEWSKEAGPLSRELTSEVFSICAALQRFYLQVTLDVTEGYMQGRREADSHYNLMLNGFRATLDRRDLVRRVTREACTSLGYRRAILFFYEDVYEDGYVRAASAHDFQDSMWARNFMETFVPAFFTAGDSVEAKALFGDRLMVVNRNEPGGLEARTILVHPAADAVFAFVPINAKDSPAALLYVETQGIRREISDRDRELLQIFCDTVGFALQNSRLFHEVSVKGKSLNHLMSRVNTAHEEERRRIARDLHDVVAQSLLKIIYSSTFALDFINEDPALAVDEIEEIRGKARESLSELRNIIGNLRPSSLEILGLQETLRRYTERFEEQSGIITNANLEGVFGLNAQAELAVFRIFQEALANVQKHAQAGEVTIDSSRDGDDLTLMIRDNGVGFDPSKIEDHQSTGERLGLLAMRERAELLGGKLEIDSRQGDGTTIVIKLPVQKEA